MSSCPRCGKPLVADTEALKDASLYLIASPTKVPIRYRCLSMVSTHDFWDNPWQTEETQS